MSVNPIFGSIVTGGRVRQAMETTVRRWIGSYLAELAAQDGIAAPPVFRSYNPVLVFDVQPENQLPACIIVAPGLAAAPIQRASGWAAPWTVGVASVVSAKDWETTLALGERYAAAVRALVLQHQSLGGFAAGTEWMRERYDELDEESARTILGALVEFTVWVERVVDGKAGPTDPDAIPTEWPVVGQIVVNVE